MSKKTPLREDTVQLICGKAKPGPSLAFFSKKMALFCKEFNEKTKDRNGELVNVKIIVYGDDSYEYNIGTCPSIYLLKNRPSSYKELKSGSNTQKKEEKKKMQEKERKQISSAELEKVAHQMMPSLNTNDLEKAKKIIAGTARSIGIKIED